MSESDRNNTSERNKLRIEDPTLLGKVIGASTVAAKIVGSGVGLVMKSMADMIVDVEKAFKDGLDPNIDDAKIINEKVADEKKTKRKSG